MKLREVALEILSNLKIQIKRRSKTENYGQARFKINWSTANLVKASRNYKEVRLLQGT